MERMRLEGGELLDAVKRLVHEGTVRRIVVKQGEETVVEFPLTVGVVGAAVAPALAAAGAIAALITDCTIEVEREDGAPADGPGGPGAGPAAGTGASSAATLD